MASVGVDQAHIKDLVRARLLSNPDRTALETVSPPERRVAVRSVVADVLRAERAILSSRALTRVVNQVSDEVVGLGPIERLVHDPEVSEVMVNGASDVFVERKGRVERVENLFIEGEEQVRRLIERIVSPLGLRVDESSPYVDARLSDGSRVNAIVPPLSLCGPVLTIRKFTFRSMRPDDLVELGSLSRDMLEFLGRCVRARANIVVSGGTGSGKTTLLGVLSSYIPDEERLITIEDAAELRLAQPHVIPLEARPPNAEGAGEVTVRDLVRNALRMRPDRIIIGEVRGGEALDMLQAMNTGHEGSLSTAHANSPRDALSRLETMALMSDVDLPAAHVREQIGSAVDLIVHTARLPGGHRAVVRVSSVEGSESGHVEVRDLFSWTRGPERGFRRVGRSARLEERLSGADGDDAGGAVELGLIQGPAPLAIGATAAPALASAGETPGGETVQAWPGRPRRLGSILE